LVSAGRPRTKTRICRSIRAPHRRKTRRKRSDVCRQQ
jgi:hypothetical protein